MLRDGTAPNEAKAAKAETDKRAKGAAFPLVAAAWLAARKPEWAAETYRKAAYVVDTYLAPKLRRVSVTTPVSYTHLDVYKRQTIPTWLTLARIALLSLIHI